VLAREVLSRGDGTCAPWWLAHGAAPTSGSAIQKGIDGVS
jgi:hypothetical protein